MASTKGDKCEADAGCEGEGRPVPFAAMSTLLVVRHGQASFGSADYDQLSPLGETQSERLGKYLAERKVQVDALYTGPARRHRQTAEAMHRGAAAAGLGLPEARLDTGLAEFPAFKLFAQHQKSSLHEAVGTEGKSGAGKSFERICEAWMHGSIDTDELESAVQFEARVTAAVSAICRGEGRGKTVVLVTSGGPTMMAMKCALGLDAARACALLWVIANSSLTEFRYREDQTSLVAFNRIAHLEDEHLTYR